MALAKIKSIIPSNRTLFSNSFLIKESFSESAYRIFSISIFSLIFNVLISLFISKIEVGSINTVEPEDEISWTSPETWLLYSSFTGITKRLSRIVIIGSIKYLE